MDETKNLASRQGIDLTIQPYIGVQSLLTTGCRDNTDPDFVPNFIYQLNRQGHGIGIAFNAPLYFLSDAELFEYISFWRSEINILTELQNSGAKYNVKNSVTITDDRIMDIVKHEYSELMRIASCIRVSGDQQSVSNKYKQGFKNADLVVPAHLHVYNNPQAFLKHFHDKVHQLLVFLNFSCGSVGPICAQHYCEISSRFIDELREHDPRMADNIENKAILENNYQKVIAAKKPKYPGCTKVAALEFIAEKLNAVISGGVNHFKIPRPIIDIDTNIHYTLGKLLSAFSKYAPENT